MLEELKFTLALSRPRFWLYLGGTYALGYAAGAVSIWEFAMPYFLLHLIYFLTIANVFLYGVNDIFDTDTDKFNRKKGTKEARIGKRNYSWAKWAVALSLLASSFLVCLQATLWEKLLTVAFLTLSAAYSTPPVRFKARPVLDFSSNVLYALPAVIGFFQSSASFVGIWAFAAAFLWTGAMHLFSAVPDIPADRKANVRTSAVAFGGEKALAVCAAFWAGFSFIVISSGYFGILGYASLIYPAVPIALLVFRKLSLEGAYWLFPYINGVLGFIAFWHIVISNGLVRL